MTDGGAFMMIVTDGGAFDDDSESGVGCVYISYL